MIQLNRLQYFVSNMLITLFGLYVSASSGLLGNTRYDGWIIAGIIIWYTSIAYTAAARMKNMGYENRYLWFSVILVPLLIFNYVIGFIYLSLRQSK